MLPRPAIIALSLIALSILSPATLAPHTTTAAPIAYEEPSSDPSAWTPLDASSYSVGVVGEYVGSLEDQSFSGWYTDTVVADPNTGTIIVAWARWNVDASGTDQIYLAFLKPIDADGDGSPESYQKIVRYVASVSLNSLDSLVIGGGRILVTWTYTNSYGKNAVMASLYDTSGNLLWIGNVRTSDIYYNEWSRACYIGGADRFLVVWYTSDGALVEGKWLYYDSSSGWTLTDAFIIDDTNDLYYTKADQMLCIGGSSKALVVLRKYDSTEGYPDLYAALVDTNNGIQEIKLYDYDGSEETVGVRGAYRDGYFVVPLLSGTYVRYQVVAESDGSIVATKTLTSNGEHPYVISLSDRFVIAWIDKYYDPNGDPKVANIDPSTWYYYYKVIDTTTDYAKHPLIASRSSRLIYLWTGGSSTTNYDIKYAYIDLGTPTSTPSISESGILVSDSNNQLAHGLGVLGDGEYIVAYTDTSDGEEDLLAYVTLPGSESVTTITLYKLPRDADSYKQKILDLIDGASSEIYIAVAFWDEGDNPCSTPGTIAYELVQKKQRNPSIDIRVILDNDTDNDPVKTCLADNGISVIDDSSATDKNHIMHDKFMVVDGSKLIVATVNFITDDFDENNNTAIYIESKALAYFYKEEFHHMWNNGNGLFGTDKTEDHSFVAFVSYGGRIIVFEGYFSPQEYGDRSRIPSAILAYITRAESSVYFASYIFTTSYYVTPIYNAIVSASASGKEVRGIFDELMNVDVPGRRLYWFIDKGVPVAIDNHPYKMHAKLFVIDNKTAVLGSWNPTKSATINHDENILIIRDPDAAAGFAEQMAEYILEMYNAANFVRSPYHYNPTHLVITKVMFYPDTSGQPAGEWVEIYNPTDSPVDLSNYVIGDCDNLIDGDDEGMYRFPEGASIGAHSYIVVAYSATAFYQQYGLKPNYEIVDDDPEVPDLTPYDTARFTGSWNLSDDGDEVILAIDQDGFLQVIDAVWYGSSTYMTTSIGQPNSAAPLDTTGIQPGQGIVDKNLTGDTDYLDAIQLSDKYTLQENPQPIPEPAIIALITALTTITVILILKHRNPHLD